MCCDIVPYRIGQRVGGVLWFPYLGGEGRRSREQEHCCGTAGCPEEEEEEEVSVPLQGDGILHLESRTLRLTHTHNLGEPGRFYFILSV